LRAPEQLLIPHTASSGAESDMPRTTWKGFLRLSLVSCPVYLTPAATKTKSIRLHQVWMPRGEPREEPDFEEFEERERPAARRTAETAQPTLPRPRATEDPDEPGSAARIALRPVDRTTGEAIERDQVVKGYEFDRGRFVTFTPDELKALDIESSRTIDLTSFVPRIEIDPVYFDAPYYIYPDGTVADEVFQVIGAAMAGAGMAGIGRLTISRHERMVMVEPRGAGMVLITLRAAAKVRPAEFGAAEGVIDPEMVAIAEAIIKRRGGRFDQATFRVMRCGN
jgi:DNA end-binding protein Ku